MLRLLIVALAALGCPAFAASAVPRVAMPANLSAVLDLRLVGADGERSWTDGGWGKSRFGAGIGDFDLDPVAAEAALIWQPPLSWDLRGTFVVASQHAQDQPLDLVEAFVTWRPVPTGPARLSVRAGMFWPPVSLEHEGAAWTVADMVTPSAINSWIGEEVKVIGAESTIARPVGGSQVAATVGLFGFNDTSGTLLGFRGWALHDQKATAFSRQPLPTLNAFMQAVQAPATRPVIELDGRPGFYARLAWSMAAPVALDAFYYDNRGDPAAKTRMLQWGWRTRFLNLGARIDLGEHTRLLAQALTGTTVMGPASADGNWVETRFRSAYLRITHELGAVALSGRLDLFDTRERGRRMGPEENEQGWALTGAAAVTLSDQAMLLVEALHVDSVRGTRLRDGLAPGQEQNVVQAALRLTL